MGATIDDLQIRLQGDSKSANKEIDTVIKNLQNLSTALGGFKSVPGLQSVTKAFNEMKTATNGIDAGKIKNISNSIRSLASSLMSLDKSARSLNLSTAENQMKVLDGIIKNESMKLMKDWGISAKDSAGVVESSIKKIVTSYKGISERGNSIFGKGVFDDAVQGIKPLITYTDKAGSSYQGLLDHIAKTNSNSKVFLPFSPSDFPDFDVMRATLGKAFSTSATGATDLTAYVRDLNSTLGHTVDIGTSDQETFENLYRVVSQARSEVERTNASFQKMSTESGTLQSAINGVVRSVSEMNASMNNGFGIQNKVPTAEMQGSNFEGLARQIGSLGGIDLSNIGDTSKLVDLARNISQLGHKGITQAVANLPQLTEGLKQFVTEMNKVGEVSFNAEGLSNLANSISRLGSKTSTVAVENIPKLKDAINSLLSDLSKAPAISDNTVRSLEAMAQLANKAGNSFNGAKSGITGFANNTVSNFEKVKVSASKVISAFGKVAVAAGKVTGINRIVNGVQRLVPASNQAQSGIKGLAMKFGTLYASAFMVTRVFGKFKGAIESAMDYVETYDYFRAAFNQVAASADLSKWKELGYKSAEEYANSFRERAEKVTKQLSGFEITESGALLDTGTKSLGLNPKAVMDTQALFGQMSSSMGVASDTATKLSRVLTEIGGDLASVKNMSFGDVWENLSSGLVGMSRAVDKYGVNIRNANMQQELMKLGINANITKLSQQDKALLRTIIILNSTKYAWGNLADTINSPANSIRIFQENMASVSRTLGSIFLPVISKVMPYVNGLAIAIRRLVEYIAKLLGVDMSDYMKGLGGGSGNEMLSDALDAADEANDTADAVDNIGKSADKAAKKQKKFNKQLAAFDELNNYTTSESEKNPKSSSASSSGAPNVTDKLTAALDDALSKYQKVWDKAYKRMQNKAEDIANKIQRAFKRAWTTGSGYELGKAFAGWLNKGINWWNKHLPTFASTSKKIAGILATAVNGAIWNLNWSGLGKAIGGSIKAYLDANTHFFDTVQWEKLGRGLADSLNAFVDSGVIESYFANIGSKIRAIIETLFGFSEGFDFSDLGTAIGKGLNKILGKMDKKINGLSGWEKLGKTVSNLVKGALDTGIAFLTTFKWEKLGKGISKAITSVDFKGIAIKLTNFSVSIFNAITKFLGGVSWFKVGQKIGDFIGNIKWGKIIWNFAKLAGAVIKAIAGAFAGSISKAPISTAIITMFSLLKWTGLGKRIFINLAGKVVGSIGNAISVASTSGIKAGIMSLFTTAAGGLSVGGIAAIIGAPVLLAIANMARIVASRKIYTPKVDITKTEESAKKLKKVTDDMETDIENTQQLINDIGSIESNAENEGDALQTLADRYKDLAKKEHLSASEKFELKEKAQLLIEKIPSLKRVIDKETGAYKGNWQELEKKVQLQKKELKYEAAKEALKGVYKQQVQNQIDLASVTEKVNAAKKKRDELQKKDEENLKRIKEIEGKIKEIQARPDGYSDENKKKVEAYEDELDKLYKNSTDYMTEIKQYEKEIADAEKKQNKLKEKGAELSRKEVAATKYIDEQDKKRLKTIKQLAKEAKGIKQIKLTAKMDDKSKKQVESFKDLKNKTVTAIAKAKETGNYSKIVETWKGFKDKAKKVLTAALQGKLDEKSYKEVINTWDSLSDEDKKVLEAQLKGKQLQDFQDLQTAFNNIQSKEVQVTAKATKFDASTIDKDIKKFEKQKITFATQGKYEWVKTLEKRIKALNNAKYAINFYPKVTKGIKNILGNNVLSDDYKADQIKKTTLMTIKADKFIPEWSKNAIAKAAGKASGGIFKGGKWNPIQSYASGGIPKSAQFFMAREAGPELVGTIGNHTAVMNNDQIVASVSDGVAKALAPAINQMTNTLLGMQGNSGSVAFAGEVPVYIDGREVFRAVGNQNDDFKRRTGRSRF